MNINLTDLSPLGSNPLGLEDIDVNALPASDPFFSDRVVVVNKEMAREDALEFVQDKTESDRSSGGMNPIRDFINTLINANIQNDAISATDYGEYDGIVPVGFTKDGEEDYNWFNADKLRFLRWAVYHDSAKIIHLDDHDHVDAVFALYKGDVLAAAVPSCVYEEDETEPVFSVAFS